VFGRCGAVTAMRPRVILVTDPAFGDDATVRCIEAAAKALPNGWLCVQLRDKGRPSASLRVFGSRLRVVTRAVGASLVLNGHAEIGRDLGAEGVHLGTGASTVDRARSAFGRPAWISVAAHSDEEVQRAVTDGADAVLVSPIFASRPPSVMAPAKAPRGLDAVQSARAIAEMAVAQGRGHLRQRFAVYALGGIGPDNARACLRAGADGIAVLRSLLGSARPSDVARRLGEAFVALGSVYPLP
jgi:thiamine-phosphate pyrophosphorylase